LDTANALHVGARICGQPAHDQKLPQHSATKSPHSRLHQPRPLSQATPHTREDKAAGRRVAPAGTRGHIRPPPKTRPTRSATTPPPTARWTMPCHAPAPRNCHVKDPSAGDRFQPGRQDHRSRHRRPANEALKGSDSAPTQSPAEKLNESAPAIARDRQEAQAHAPEGEASRPALRRTAQSRRQKRTDAVIDAECWLDKN